MKARLAGADEPTALVVIGSTPISVGPSELLEVGVWDSLAVPEPDQREVTPLADDDLALIESMDRAPNDVPGSTTRIASEMARS